MGGAKPVRAKVTISAALLALSLLQAARADDGPATDPSILKACDALGDLFATLVRNGDKANARVLEPKIKECLVLQKAELKRQTGELADRFDTMKKLQGDRPATTPK